jgi:hypothetical protein
MVFGLHWALQAAQDRRVAAGITAGVLFGLAYLIRPEALFLSVLLLVPLLALGFARREGRGAIASAAGLALALALIASPYVAFLSLNTGHLRWEGKGTIAYAIGQRVSSGMTYLEASYGIDQDLQEQGIHLKSNREVLRSGAMRITDWGEFYEVARYFGTSAQRNLGELFRIVADERPFGSPVLFILAMIGLFRTRWSQQRITAEVVVLTLFCENLIVLLVGQGNTASLSFRHTLLVLLILIIWAAKGTDELRDWATSTASALAPTSSRRFGLGCQCLVLLALWGVAFRNVGTVGDFVQSKWAYLKAAGVWLERYEPAPKKIFATRTAVPYYAKGNLWYLPYASSALALRYLDTKNPDFIVLQSPGLRPYEQSWMDDGVPEAKARLIYRGGSEGEGRVMIYEWGDRHPERK